MRRLSPEDLRNSRRRRRPRTGVLGFLREIAGNATTETVIMIPVFIVIWGGVYFTQQRYRKAINTVQFTRSHVWQHAYGGCEGTAPAGTTFTDGADSSSDGFMEGVTDLLFSVPLTGFVIDEVEGRRETSVERPRVLGTGSVAMEFNLTVMCNEQTQEDLSLVEVALGMFFGGG